MSGMHGERSLCLSTDELVAYHEGRFSGRRLDSLERHLAGCSECSTRVEEISHPTFFAESTVQAGPDDDGAEPSTDLDNVTVSGRAEGDLPGVASTVGPTDPSRGAVRLRPGQRLGPYLLANRLGAGGMGVVYEAHDEERDARVALKALPRVDARMLYLFKREFRALADLHHPNLVTLYEFACDGGLWYFTMERVDGGDFLSYVRPERPAEVEASTVAGVPGTTMPQEPGQAAPTLPAESMPSTRNANHDDVEETEQMAAAVGVRSGGHAGLRTLDVDRLRGAIRQLAEGVEALHAAGKLHRDLKPSNVMVTTEGRVVLLDFGLVAESAVPAFADATPSPCEEPPSHYDESSSGGIAGTISYMAPEQAIGEPLTEACDWYSVGVILYESLAGRRPFAGSSSRQVREKLAAAPRPPREFVPGVPEDLEALCMELLRRAPEERPKGAEVVRRLGGEPASTSSGDRNPGIRRLPFVGRERHLAALDDAYRAAKAGRDVTVFVHGVSGVGKSALIQRFLERLPAGDGAVVLAGRCFEQESVPYKALDNLVDALARHLRRLPAEEAAGVSPPDAAALARVFPVLNLKGGAPAGRVALDAQELRHRAIASLRTLLARLASRGPLVLAIDDLQWGDFDSARLLVELLRPPEPPPLLLLAAYRSEYAATSPCLRSLLGSWPLDAAGADRRELVVEPMGDAEAAELALRLLRRDDPEARDFAVSASRESGGNPYFILELVEQAEASPDLHGHPGEPGRIDFDEILWRRIGRLPEASRRLLEAIAVAGRPLPLRAALLASAEAVGTVESEVRPEASSGAVRPDTVLRSGSLIRRTGPRLDDEVETYHDRIRETVVTRLSAQSLRGLHARLAEVLEKSGDADVEALAAHLEGAGEATRAGAYFARAADQAAEALAFDRAAELYRRSIRLRPPHGDEARVIRTRLGDALANAGRGPEAAQEYLAASEGAASRESIELQRKAAFQYYMSGHLDEGESILRGVLTQVGMALPRTRAGAMATLITNRLRLQLRGLGHVERHAKDIADSLLTRIDVSWSVGAGLGTKDPIIGPAFQSRNLLLALRAGEPLRLVRALAWEAANHANVGTAALPRTLALFEAAREVARRCDEPYVRGFLDLVDGILAFHQHRWREGAERAGRAAATFRGQCIGAAWELGQAHTFTLWCLSWMGEYDAMAVSSARILEEAEKKGDMFTAANLGGYIRPLALLAKGEPDAAIRSIAECVSPFSRSFYHVQHFTALMATTPAHLYRGDPGAAYREILSHEPAFRRNLILHVQLCRIVSAELRARTALAAVERASTSERARLLADAGRQVRRLDREDVPLARTFARLIRAKIAAARGEPSAVDGLRESATAFDDLSMGHFAAAVRWRLGQTIGGDEGRLLVEGARSWMAARAISDPSRMADALVPRIGG